MDQGLMKLLHNCVIWSTNKIMTKHSHGVSTGGQIEQGRVIWSYEDVVKVSYQMDMPK